MKFYYGNKTKSLTQYYEDKKRELDKAQSKNAKETINQIALYEALILLKATEHDPIMQIEDFMTIFDMKYDFIRNNILKNPHFTLMELDPNVKQMIIQIGKASPGDEITGQDEKNSISLVITKDHIKAAKMITRKKSLFFRSHLSKFVQLNFYISLDGEKLPLTSEGIAGVLDGPWKSGKTIKDEKGYKYDMQLYRELKKENHYLKLLYVPPQASDRHVTRYLKL